MKKTIKKGMTDRKQNCFSQVWTCLYLLMPYCLHPCKIVILFLSDEEYNRAIYAHLDEETELAPKPLESIDEQHLIFQPNAAVEFPTVWFGRPKIPHIMHFVNNNSFVPSFLASIVRSYFTTHPDWEFRFWTFESGRELIRKHHPYLLGHFDCRCNNSYENSQRKSDMIRHVALYEYGGFTPDQDVSVFRSLDIATKKYGCIIPAEPFEHSVLLYNFDFILSTKVMLCRPKHPFFKHILEFISNSNDGSDSFDATGGGLLTTAFLSYNNISMTDVQKRKTDSRSNSPFCYKGERPEDDVDAVYVPNTQYFNDKVHHSLLSKKGNLKACSDNSLQAFLTKRACAEFNSRKELREKMAYTFTTCHYYQIWDSNFTKVVLHIRKIIPKVIL